MCQTNMLKINNALLRFFSIAPRAFPLPVALR